MTSKQLRDMAKRMREKCQLETLAAGFADIAADALDAKAAAEEALEMARAELCALKQPGDFKPA